MITRLPLPPPKTSITLGSELSVNVYLPTKSLQKFTLDGITYDNLELLKDEKLVLPNGEEYYKIITLENSFHGRTLTTLAATGQEHFHKLFKPLTDGFIHVPANDIEALKKAVAENKVAAIMFETIQGEGGILPLTNEFVNKIFELAESNDILTIG